MDCLRTENHGKELITEDALIKRQLLYSMIRIRMVEEEIVRLYPEQEMRCPVHLCIGQEAVPAGFGLALQHDDKVLSHHRAHGHYIAKGGNLKSFFAELYGKSTGCSSGKGGSMHLTDLEAGFIASTSIVASTIPIGVGVAFAKKIKQDGQAVAVFMGDGAVEEGVFHESIAYSVLNSLPIVFVCENNLYASQTPLGVRQSPLRNIHEMVRGHGIQSLQGSGNDAAEVFRLAGAALDRARSYKGPTFLEFMTYRWLEHCGPYEDNDLGYRSEEEVTNWKQNCPIETLKSGMLRAGLVTMDDIDGWKKSLDEEIRQAVKFAHESPFPEEPQLFAGIFAE